MMEGVLAYYHLLTKQKKECRNSQFDQYISYFRYVAIILGLSLLVSHLLLWYGASNGRRDILTTFFILTIPAILLYWVWFAYTRYGLGDTGEASKEVWLYSVV